LAASKKQKIDQEVELTETQTQGILDAIEDIVADSLPKTFECPCGKDFNKTNTSKFSNTLKSHFSTYCKWFKTWRQVLLHLPTIGGT
jgi:hypothetical protein